MEKERNLNYWTIRKFSLLYSYYAIIDTTDYLADQLFVKNEVRVWFGQEYICPDGPYCVIFCKCRKRDTGAFESAMNELPRKMLLRGHTDYIQFCEGLKNKIAAAWKSGGELQMRKLVPLHKQSKKQRKEYNAKQRGSWNGISPVTRIVPNGKAYDRNRIKREDHQFAE